MRIRLPVRLGALLAFFAATSYTAAELQGKVVENEFGGPGQ